MYRFLIPLLFFFFLSNHSFAQESEKIFKLYFPTGKYEFSEIINRQEIDAITGFLNQMKEDNESHLTKLLIASYSSPEGSFKRNQFLSDARLGCVTEFVKRQWTDSLKLETVSHGASWGVLHQLVEDSSLENKEYVLGFIERIVAQHEEELGGNSLYTLSSTKGNMTYEQLDKHFLSCLRMCMLTFNYKHVSPKVGDYDTIASNEKEVDIECTEKESIPVQPTNYKRRSLNISTNVAEWGVGVPNIGLETNLNSRWSIEIPFSYSPFVIKNDYRIKILKLQPEFKYWLNELYHRHYLGVHFTCGWFNVALDKDYRYQSRGNSHPAVGGGVSYGYSIALSPRWFFECSVGGGYLHLDYNEYYNVENGALRKKGNREYFGLTKLGVNFVYHFNL